MKGILTFACIVAAFTQLQAQTITGTVTNTEKQPIANSSVLLPATNTGVLTKGDGSFSLSFSRPGTYTLQVQASGYETRTQTFTLGEGEQAEALFELTRAISSLKEVTVTAGRRPEIVDRTPASVQVIGQRELQTQMLVSPNIANVLAQAVPALGFGTNTTSNTGQTLRGRTPLILIDGIPQSTPLRAGGRDIRTIDPAVIERIEVVKGATAIYGNGADGGIINYITRKPLGAKPFAAQTMLSATGMPVDGAGTLGGRITQQFNGSVKKFDYLVSGTYERTGVNRDANGTPLSPVYGTGESDIVNTMVKAGYNFSARHRIEGMYNYFGSAQHTKYVEQTGVYGKQPTIGVRGDHQGEREGTRYNHNAYLKYNTSALPFNTTLEASAYLQRFYTVYGFTSFFENGGQSTISSDKSGLRFNFNTPFKVSPQFTGDLVYGVDVLQDKTAQILTDGRTWVPHIKLVNTAPYLQFNANILQHLVFKTGIRYDDMNIDVPSFTQVRDSRGNGGQFINGGSLAFDAATFNTGLRFAKWDWFRPFVSYTQGFSIIDIGRYVRAAKENDIARMQIQPVKVHNYEAGFSSSNRWYALTASYFIATNKIGASLIEENGLYVQQKAPERTWGYELQADLHPMPQLSFGAAYVYVEGKADVNKNNRFDDAADMYLNSTKIAPPKTTAYVRVQPRKEVSLYLQWLHYGDRKRFAPRSTGLYGYGEGAVEGAGIVNFSGSWQVAPRVQLNLGVENLLNRDYYTPIAQWSAQNADYIKANGMRLQAGLAIKW